MLQQARERRRFSFSGNGNGPSDARAQAVQEPETQRGRKRPDVVSRRAVLSACRRVLVLAETRGRLHPFERLHRRESRRPRAQPTSCSWPDWRTASGIISLYHLVSHIRHLFCTRRHSSRLIVAMWSGPVPIHLIWLTLVKARETGMRRITSKT